MFPIQSNTEDTSKLYVDGVFSTYLYTGNGSTQTINNGIDLADKGGMVWIKTRDAGSDHVLYDTTRGINKPLIPNSTAAQQTEVNSFNSFGASGFSLGGGGAKNNNLGNIYASWTFRKAPKFFDVVTYTGNGSAGRQITHSLGGTPGMVIVKRYDAAAAGDYWAVWHRGLTSGNFIVLNTTAAQTSTNAQYVFGNDTTTVDPTSSNFTVGSGSVVNSAAGTYVAYLFAHDTASDGLIQCGSFTTDGSGNATVNLGWEPQFVLWKSSSATNPWSIFDSMRGMVVGGADAQLCPNNTQAEDTSTDRITPTANGFSTVPGGFGNGSTGIYLAIRRPNKPPTTGTQVFNAVARTGTGAATTSTAGFPVDLVITKKRSSTTLTGAKWVDRLRGKTITLDSTSTANESTVAQSITALDSMTTVSIGTDGSYNTNTHTYVDWFFLRYPGVLDVVCYTGTGVARTVNHNLGVVPELMIIKGRSVSRSWIIGYGFGASSWNRMLFDTAGATNYSYSAAAGMSDMPTNGTFKVDANVSTNELNTTYVAYLFATIPGISKVGSYTGNGTSQMINCGFTTGARFILIKSAGSTGYWYVWDTARGIVAATDPHLRLNTTEAEVTTDYSIDPDTSGFIVNQVAATNVNVNGASYIYLAFA